MIITRRKVTVALVLSAMVSLLVSPSAQAGSSVIFATTGTGPRGIVIDSLGNIYTANSGSNNVSKITPDGTSSILGNTATFPRGIAIDSSGNIYTAN